MYFDNAATTIVSENIVDIVVQHMKNQYGNAGSIHYEGIQSKKNLEWARSVVAKAIGAEDNEVVFTSGGSESNNLALVGVLNYLRSNNKSSVITSTIEHPSVINAIEYLKNKGITIKMIESDSAGHISTNTLNSMIDDTVGLVSIIAVNNEIGSIQDVRQIGKICREKNVLFHTDCVQAMGTIAIDVNAMCIDFLSLSGHKFHAPKGVGVLYARNKEILAPMIFGGGQEFNIRSGTENIPGIMGLAYAILDVYKTPVLYTNIKKYFVKCIKTTCVKSDIQVMFNGDSDKNNSKIVNMRFPNVDGQTLTLMLSSRGVCVSAGSACKSHDNSPSHTLKAIGLTDDEALSSIRVSFSKYTTKDEVRRGVEIICQCVKTYLRMGATINSHI